MTLQQLQSFIEVARGLSFRRAAERLHLAQPSVSAHIRELERELETPLFERLGRRIRLTEAGETLLDYAGRILSDVKAAREAVQALADVAQGTLLLGTTISLVGTLLPPVVRRLQLDAPQVALSLHLDTSEAVATSVRRGDLDLGIVYLMRDEPSLLTIPLLEDEFILVAAPDDGLGHIDSVDVLALGDLPIIGLSNETTGRAFIDRELARHGIHLRILLEMSSSDAIKGMVAAGVAPAFVSRLAVERELATGYLREVPVRGVSLRHLVVAVARQGQARGAMLAGLRALRSVYPGPLARAQERDPSVRTRHDQARPG